MRRASRSIGGSYWTSLSEAANDLVVIARVARTRGLRGEVVADLYTDFPERFADLDRVIAIAPDGSRRSLQIEEHWFHGNRVILKFADYDSIDDAKALSGYQIAVPEEERVELPADHFYEWELVGCRVESLEGALIGLVSEVMKTGGVEVLLITGDAGREYMVPMAHDICVGIDIAQKRIRIDPPEGLLEL
jgi:16S rRNA processing protein RimM